MSADFHFERNFTAVDAAGPNTAAPDEADLFKLETLPPGAQRTETFSLSWFVAGVDADDKVDPTLAGTVTVQPWIRDEKTGVFLTAGPAIAAVAELDLQRIENIPLAPVVYLQVTALAGFAGADHVSLRATES